LRQRQGRDVIRGVFVNNHLNHNRFTRHLLLIIAGMLVCCAAGISPLSAADKGAEAERIRILADRLVTNDKESYAEFQGNVEASQGDFLIRSETLRIYYKRGAEKDPSTGDEESIRKVVATGNVRIDADDKKATSDKAEYTPEDGTLILTGPDSTLVSDKNSITGSRITLHRESRQLKVEGGARQRVHAVFYTKKGRRLLGGTKPAPSRPGPEAAPPAEPEPKERVDIVQAPETRAPEKKPAVEIIETAKSAPAPEQKPSVEIIETPVGKPETAREETSPEKTPSVKESSTRVATAAEQPKTPPAEAVPQKIDEERLEDGKEAESLEERARKQPPARPAAEQEAEQPEMAAITPAPAPEPIAGDAPQAAETAALQGEDEEALEPEEAYATVPIGDLYKTAAIAAIDNQTFYKGPEVETVLFDGIVKIIQDECPEVDLRKPGDPGYPGFLSPLPMHPSGGVDNFAVAALGRQIGLNSVITVSVTEIALERDVKGLLWMKDARFFLRVAVALEVFDAETATKIIDDSFAYLVDLEDSKYDIAELDKEIPPEMVQEAFDNLVPQVGDYIAETLNQQPWKAFVTQVTDDGVILSSGTDVGLAAGNVFDVFDARIIQGAGGHRFIVPGLKTGSVLVTEVRQNSADAILIAGDGIREGSTVKPGDD
jgi:lipopolysaccharide export system protein LptA